MACLVPPLKPNEKDLDSSRSSLLTMFIAKFLQINAKQSGLQSAAFEAVQSIVQQQYMIEDINRWKECVEVFRLLLQESLMVSLCNGQWEQRILIESQAWLLYLPPMTC